MGGQPRRAAGVVQTRLEHVAAEQDAATLVVQHRVAVEVAAGAWGTRPGMSSWRSSSGHVTRNVLVRPDPTPIARISGPNASCSWNSAPYPWTWQAARREPAPAPELGEGLVGVEARGLPADLALVGREHPAAGAEADRRRAGEAGDRGPDRGPPGQPARATSSRDRNPQPSSGRSLRVSVHTGQSAAGRTSVASARSSCTSRASGARGLLLVGWAAAVRAGRGPARRGRASRARRGPRRRRRRPGGEGASGSKVTASAAPSRRRRPSASRPRPGPGCARRRAGRGCRRSRGAVGAAPRAGSS